MIRKTLFTTYGAARRLAIAVVGGTLVAIGVIMIVTPGPALIIIPAGLAVLGLEFAFARRWLRLVRRKISGRNRQQRSRRAESYRADIG